MSVFSLAWQRAEELCAALVGLCLLVGQVMSEMMVCECWRETAEWKPGRGRNIQSLTATCLVLSSAKLPRLKQVRLGGAQGGKSDRTRGTKGASRLGERQK